MNSECWGFSFFDLDMNLCINIVMFMVCIILLSTIPVCIISGWVMGGVKDKYLKFESAGYQYLGQCATGLYHLKKYFSVSILHFDFHTLVRISYNVFIRNMESKYE